VPILAAADASGPQAPPGVLAHYELSATAGVRHALPQALAEISGLATGADGRLFAHGDERAIVYQLDPQSGRVVTRFWLGRSGIQGDFEGIAIAGERFFLVESQGTLYEFREGRDREPVRYHAVATGLAGRCEVEGLAYDARTDALLLACKTTSGAALRNHVVVFSFSLAEMKLEPTPRLRIPLGALAPLGLKESFHASGIEVHPSGSLVLVAARDGAILEVSRDGRLLFARRLERRWHPQAEGIAFLRDGSLVLADEAQSGGTATLSVYPTRALRPSRSGF
jgi:uncharacterized protein YjiK